MQVYPRFPSPPRYDLFRSGCQRANRAGEAPRSGSFCCTNNFCASMNYGRLYIQTLTQPPNPRRGPLSASLGELVETCTDTRAPPSATRSPVRLLLDDSLAGPPNSRPVMLLIAALSALRLLNMYLSRESDEVQLITTSSN